MKTVCLAILISMSSLIGVSGCTGPVAESHLTATNVVETNVIDKVRCGSRPLVQLGINVPLHVVHDENRFQYLPRTQNLLTSRGELQAVVLGDSIMNDTFGPQYGGATFHASTAWGMDLVASYYGARVWTIVSVLGSTGAWWYQEGDRVQNFVMKYDPDVVFVGGISNRDDFNAIRAVIAKIRQIKPVTEIALMSDAVNLSALPVGQPLAITVDEDSYRAKLRLLAQEQQVAFIDMRGPYNDFVLRTSKLYPNLGHDYFQRDAVHANAQGREVLRGIFTTFMTLDESCID